jgi:hypothetical protein
MGSLQRALWYIITQPQSEVKDLGEGQAESGTPYTADM